MVVNLEEYMCTYMKSLANPLKGCLLAALKSKDGYLSLHDERLGSTIESVDLKLCGLLASAGLFREEEKLTMDGHNHYRLFYLTDVGKKMAEQADSEGHSTTMPKSAEMPNH